MKLIIPQLTLVKLVELSGHESLNTRAAIVAGIIQIGGKLFAESILIKNANIANFV